MGELKVGDKVGKKRIRGIVPCDTCGKDAYIFNKEQENSKHHFCSNACVGKFLRVEKRDNCICPICGKSFYAEPYQIKNTKNPNCCSKECLRIAMIDRMSGEKNHQYGLRGSKNASYQGDIIEKKNHRLVEKMVYMPEHPFRDSSNRVKLHRLIVEENSELFDDKYFVVIDGKKYLPRDVVVHHLDCNHNNNSITNLIPLTISEHSKYHASIKKELTLIGKLHLGEASRFFAHTKNADRMLPLPKRKTAGSAGYDFVLPIDVTIQPKSYTPIIPLNVKAYMQQNEYLALHIRSSIAIKDGVVLATGTSVIDADYVDNKDNEGNIGICLFNNSDSVREYKKGTRICQGIFMAYYTVRDDDCVTERVGGYGSTEK